MKKEFFEESWESMSRMKQRLRHGEDQYYCRPWSLRLIRTQWDYAIHITEVFPLLWIRKISKFNWNPVHDDVRDAIPCRNRGRSRLKWDDHIRDFCWNQWPASRARHWMDIFAENHPHTYGDEFILFMSGMYV